MASKIAYCIATKGRSELIQEFLEKCAPFYMKLNIDIHIYDSSEDDATKMVVDYFSDRLSGLSYHKMPSDIPLPEKVFEILFDPQIMQDYDYIWVANDAIRYKEDGLERITDALNSSYDLVVLDHFYSGVDESISVFRDIDAFFQSYLWKTTLLGSVILNIQSVLKEANREFYREIFCTSKIQNWSINYLYFQRLAEIENACAARINVSGKMTFSYLKKQNHWRTSVFQLLCEEWVDLIDMLPECYTNKGRVCRQGAFDAILGDLDLWPQLRRENLYSYAVYKKYDSVWEKITYIPRRKLLILALTPRFLFDIFYGIKRKRLLGTFKKFFKKHRKILIYGVGQNGYRFAQFFEHNYLDYEGFIVTKQRATKQFYHHPVVGLSELNSADFAEIGIVIAMNEINSKEVIRVLRTKTEEDHILFLPNCQKEMDYSMGYKYIVGNGWT